MTLPLKRVLMCAPGPVHASADPVRWGYTGQVNLATAQVQHQALAGLLAGSGAEVVLLDDAGLETLADAIYTHDPSLVSSAGAILLRMGKALRRDEQGVHARAYESLGIPVLGRIETPGTVEGGDCLWVDERTLFVGRGFRTNASGIEQLAALLRPEGVEVLQFDLPYFGGPEDCTHLMSLVSLLDADLAVALLPALPVRLYEALAERGVRIVAASEEEYRRGRGMNVNVLAVGPRDCVMAEGFPETVAALEAAGCRVRTFAGSEICTKMEGGPTCLTRPLLRR